MALRNSRFWRIGIIEHIPSSNLMGVLHCYNRCKSMDWWVLPVITRGFGHRRHVRPSWEVRRWNARLTARDLAMTKARWRVGRGVAVPLTLFVYCLLLRGLEKLYYYFCSLGIVCDTLVIRPGETQFFLLKNVKFRGCRRARWSASSTILLSSFFV